MVQYYLSNQEQNLDNLLKDVQSHSEAKLATAWKTPNGLATRMKQLNDAEASYNTIQGTFQNYKIAEEYLAGRPDSDFPGGHDQKVEKLAELREDMAKVEDDRNKRKKIYQEKQQEAETTAGIRRDPDTGKWGGRVLVVTKDGNARYIENITGPESFNRMDFPKPEDIEKSTSVLAYMFTPEQEKAIKTIVSNFKHGKPVDNEEFETLLKYNPNVNESADTYSTLQKNILDVKYRYNIKRNVNEKLIDIRNIRNFRNSNITTTARIKQDYTNNQNLINPTTADGSNASKSFYMSRNDFYWSQNYNDITNERDAAERQSIQNIILNEYQPTLQYNIGLEIFEKADYAGGKAVDAALGALANNVGMGDIIGGFMSSVGEKGVQMYYNDKIADIGEDPSQLYSEEQYEHFDNPMYYIEHLFNHGTWLNTYELPFIDNGKVKNEYLRNSSDPGEWAIGGLTDSAADGGFVQKVLHKRIALSLPTTPIFNVNNPHAATFGNINLSFYLINKDDQYLDKNFQFMQALFAGTQWLSMTLGAIVATNVYHVLVPGRFAIQWAALQSKFETVGKLRTNNHMYEMYGAQNGSVSKIGMITFDTLWPEAWKVDLTIKPLTPWNFNTHMAYYLNGFGAKQRNRLATMKSAWWNTGVTLQSMKNQIEDIESRKSALEVLHTDLQEELAQKIAAAKKAQKDFEDMQALAERAARGEDLGLSGNIAVASWNGENDGRGQQLKLIQKAQNDVFETMKKIDDLKRDFTQTDVELIKLGVDIGLGSETALASQSEVANLVFEKDYEMVQDYAKQLNKKDDDRGALLMWGKSEEAITEHFLEGIRKGEVDHVTLSKLNEYGMLSNENLNLIQKSVKPWEEEQKYLDMASDLHFARSSSLNTSNWFEKQGDVAFMSEADKKYNKSIREAMEKDLKDIEKDSTLTPEQKEKKKEEIIRIANTNMIPTANYVEVYTWQTFKIDQIQSNNTIKTYQVDKNATLEEQKIQALAIDMSRRYANVGDISPEKFDQVYQQNLEKARDYIQREKYGENSNKAQQERRDLVVDQLKKQLLGNKEQETHDQGETVKSVGDIFQDIGMKVKGYEPTVDKTKPITYKETGSFSVPVSQTFYENKNELSNIDKELGRLAKTNETIEKDLADPHLTDDFRNKIISTLAKNKVRMDELSGKKVDLEKQQAIYTDSNNLKVIDYNTFKTNNKRVGEIEQQLKDIKLLEKSAKEGFGFTFDTKTNQMVNLKDVTAKKEQLENELVTLDAQNSTYLAKSQLNGEMNFKSAMSNLDEIIKYETELSEVRRQRNALQKDLKSENDQVRNNAISKYQQLTEKESSLLRNVNPLKMQDMIYKQSRGQAYNGEIEGNDDKRLKAWSLMQEQKQRAATKAAEIEEAKRVAEEAKAKKEAEQRQKNSLGGLLEQQKENNKNKKRLQDVLNDPVVAAYLTPQELDISKKQYQEVKAREAEIDKKIKEIKENDTTSDEDYEEFKKEAEERRRRLGIRPQTFEKINPK